MSKFLVLILFYFAIKCCQSKYLEMVTQQTIDVPLDHFSKSNHQTFKLRYATYDKYWKGNGPIFFYTGNEGSYELFIENTVLMWNLAPKFGALLVFAEHRYYGNSLPFGASTYTAKNMVYLKIDQVLEDYVLLINNIKTSRKSNSKVIAFGGSYGGTLATWIRAKYPAVVNGAIASSGTTLLVGNVYPCEVIKRTISNLFKAATPNDCTISIKNSWKAIRDVTSTAEGRNWLKTNWNLCTPLPTTDAATDMITWLQSVYRDLTMFNYPYNNHYVLSLPANPVKTFCAQLQNTKLEGRQLLVALGKAVRVYSNGAQCVTRTSLFQSPSFGGVPFSYQTCTELILPTCSDGNDMFENAPWDVNALSKACYTKWQVPAIQPNALQSRFHGLVKKATNIIASSGLLDPYSSTSYIYNIGNGLKSLTIPGAAHHQEFFEANPADSKSVIAARQFIENSIRTWLR